MYELWVVEFRRLWQFAANVLEQMTMNLGDTHTSPIIFGSTHACVVLLLVASISIRAQRDMFYSLKRYVASRI